MKVPIITGELPPLPDGSRMHLLLSKDWLKLQAALDSIESQTIELEGKDPQHLKRDAWIVHRPDENGKWAPGTTITRLKLSVTYAKEKFIGGLTRLKSGCTLKDKPVPMPEK